jgi:hypothetical protein
VLAALRQDRVLRRADVQLGDELERRTHALRIRSLLLERRVPEILVDVPDLATPGVRRNPEQGCAAVLQPQRWEPTACDQLVSPGGRRAHALEHERSSPVSVVDPKAPHVGLQMDEP